MRMVLPKLRACALLLPLFVAACHGLPGDIGKDAPPAPPLAASAIKVGVGVADFTPPVGFCAGQYCAAIYEQPGQYVSQILTGGADPYVSARLKTQSYGVQSRLDTRAIVVEGSNGKRVALVKIDNYLAQDMLIRRVGQLLAQGDSGITYDQIFNHVTHNHSAAYYSTLAAGVWLFEDVFDMRMFEFQARQITKAIETAAANMKPARMGATTIKHSLYKGNVVRQAQADDGTPAGYPMEFGDHGLVVVRFDDMTDPAHPKPLAAWMNWGEHPESLDGYNLHSGDYIAPLQRFVDAEIGAPVVFSQSDVGSAENTGNACQILDENGKLIRETTTGYGDNGSPQCGENTPDEGVLRDWNHHGYVQTERNVRYLADDVVRAFKLIGEGKGDVPLASDFPVDMRTAWVPGPVSHPYPSVSNCRTEPTLDGNVGVPVAGLPDCSRYDQAQAVLSPALAPLAMVIETLKAHGFNVVPDNYDGPSFMVVEENLRLKLQAVRLGDVLLASCACEAQNDLILNLESRTDEVAGNIYDGFDWACLLPDFKDDPQYTAACEVQKHYYDPAEQKAPVTGSNLDPAAIAHMRAQVHNDALGWDALAYVPYAGSEPAGDLTAIKGNFTKEELTPDLGYKLPVGVGHAGDYNGYTVSYREYQNRDSYRKALTSYGPHTADYMVTRLVRMAGAMKGGPELAAEPLDTLAAVDELRQQTLATVVGRATGAAYDAFFAVLPNDKGPAEATTQPQAIEHFQAATFTWRGGNNQIDNPMVHVEKQDAAGNWQFFAGQTGEVQTRVHYPEGIPGRLGTYAGIAEWLWTANFEAYLAFPRRLGSTPFGTYRFVVDGNIRQAANTEPYHLESEPFTVGPSTAIEIRNLAVSGGNVSFEVSPQVTYPASYESDFDFINGEQAGQRICDQCTFRPWATTGKLVKAEVVITRAKGNQQRVTARSTGGEGYKASISLAAGDTAQVVVTDNNGETGVADLTPAP